MMPQIEWKLDLGNILTIVALIIAGSMGWSAMSTKLDQHANQINQIEIKLDEAQKRLDQVRDEQIRTSESLRLRQLDEDRAIRQEQKR